MTLGTYIRNTRKQMKIRQQDFAKSIGVSKQALWMIERDKVTPSWNTISKMINKFNYDKNIITELILNNLN